MEKQTISHSILARVEQNEKYLELFFSRVLNTAIDTFHSTQKNPENTLTLTFPDNGPKKYRMVLLQNVPYSEQGYSIAIEQNFLYYMPIMACSFSGMHKHTYMDQNLGIIRTFEIFWITLETPLKKARQVYRVEGELGNRRLELDPDLSDGLMMPPHIARFNYLIQPDQLTNN